jgi:hypothetical protein
MLLVGGIPTPLKNMKVSWDDIIPNLWKKEKSCSKPPTRIYNQTFLKLKRNILIFIVHWGYI